MKLAYLMTQNTQEKCINLDAISQVEPIETKPGDQPQTRIYMTSPANMAHGHIYATTPEELQGIADGKVADNMTIAARQYRAAIAAKAAAKK